MHTIQLPGDHDDGIETFYFSGGEPHAKVPTITDPYVMIIYRGLSWEDFGQLMVVLNALWYQRKIVTLAIPYFPGARQDRNPGGNTPLTVEMYTQMLAPYVNHVVVADMHSQAGLDILQNEVLNVTEIIAAEIISFYSHTFSHMNYIIAPDKGAIERATDVSVLLDVPIVFCEKTRDFDTGRITSYKFMGDIQPGNYLVIDDICDGGATFNMLADAFYAQVPKVNGVIDTDHYKLNLYVTHPIFSRGFKDLFDRYNHIYFTDSRDIYVDTDDRITVLPIVPVIQTRMAEVHA